MLKNNIILYLSMNPKKASQVPEIRIKKQNSNIDKSAY